MMRRLPLTYCWRPKHSVCTQQMSAIWFPNASLLSASGLSSMTLKMGKDTDTCQFHFACTVGDPTPTLSRIHPSSLAHTNTVCTTSAAIRTFDGGDVHTYKFHCTVVRRPSHFFELYSLTIWPCTVISGFLAHFAHYTLPALTYYKVLERWSLTWTLMVCGVWDSIVSILERWSLTWTPMVCGVQDSIVSILHSCEWLQCVKGNRRNTEMTASEWLGRASKFWSCILH